MTVTELSRRANTPVHGVAPALSLALLTAWESKARPGGVDTLAAGTPPEQPALEQVLLPAEEATP